MSQWKSQFDDSEGTDDEWKIENLQSPEHRLSYTVSSLVFIFTYHNNIVGFKNDINFVYAFRMEKTTHFLITPVYVRHRIM